MTVHFIGAGPGAPDLLTLRGRDLIAACPVCLYAGSLVPQAVLAHCPPDAKIVNTAPMTLDEIMAEIGEAHARGRTSPASIRATCRSGRQWASRYGEIRELGIPVSVTPGVPSFAAAAAVLESELTLPGIAQSVILTRTPGRASAMPEGSR
ncbi:SAM-dependent methyltransferase [Sphingomonas sp. I4]